MRFFNQKVKILENLTFLHDFYYDGCSQSTPNRCITSTAILINAQITPALVFFFFFFHEIKGTLHLVDVQNIPEIARCMNVTVR